MDYFFLISGGVVGYLFSSFTSGRATGQTGRLKSWKIAREKFTIHIHHWVVSVIILAMLLLLNFINFLIYGVLLGTIIQGLAYEDFHKLLYKKGD